MFSNFGVIGDIYNNIEYLLNSFAIHAFRYCY